MQKTSARTVVKTVAKKAAKVSSKTASKSAAKTAVEPKINKRQAASEATKKRIFLAAEALFSEHGFNGAGAREICAKAKVDLAMIAYHFGSKQGLYKEVFMQRGRVLNGIRLASLAELMEASGGRPDLESVVRALVAPHIRLRSEAALGGLAFARMISHEMTGLQGRKGNINLMDTVFSDMVNQFIDVFAICLPHASRVDLYWAFHFSTSAMAQSMATTGRLEKMSEGACQVSDFDDALNHLASFITHGILGCVGHPPAKSGAADGPARRRKAPAKSRSS